MRLQYEGDKKARKERRLAIPKDIGIRTTMGPYTPQQAAKAMSFWVLTQLAVDYRHLLHGNVHVTAAKTGLNPLLLSNVAYAGMRA